jgi:hypothetical protein
MGAGRTVLFRPLRAVEMMGKIFSRALLVAALVTVSSTAVSAQRPTPDQARLLLQTRPDLVKQLQKRLGESGMTLDQIRARLRAEGYPEDLLDSYYPGSKTEPGDVSQEVFAAVENLGIIDEMASDSLRLSAGLPPRRRGTRGAEPTRRHAQPASPSATKRHAAHQAARVVRRAHSRHTAPSSATRRLVGRL